MGIPATIPITSPLRTNRSSSNRFSASAIPTDLTEVAQVYRMSRWERWTRLYIPCVFPYLVTGLITAAGGAWNATIVSEFVTIKDKTQMAFGLGSTISCTRASTWRVESPCAAALFPIWD